MRSRELRHFSSAVLISLIFMGAIAAAAKASGVAFLLFPELAALSYDVLLRPRGVWASAPWMLILSPVAAAILGVMITRYLPYSATSVALCIAGAMLLILIMRSPIAPAISACLLALSLDEKSWLYPLAILIGTSGLVILSIVHRRFFNVGEIQIRPKASDRVDDEIETLPTQFLWAPFFAVFLGITYMVSIVAGMRFILFPPLVVIAFEMFAHADVCPWARKPLLLPVICTLAAAAGVAAFATLGPGANSTVLVMIFSIMMLRVTSLHAVPALAIGLLPQIMTHPDWHFPLAVGIGTTLLTSAFLLFEKYFGPDRSRQFSLGQP